MSEGGGGDAVEVTRDKDSDEAANVGRGYALVEGEGGVEGTGDADEEVSADFSEKENVERVLIDRRDEFSEGLCKLLA